MAAAADAAVFPGAPVSKPFEPFDSLFCRDSVGSLVYLPPKYRTLKLFESSLSEDERDHISAENMAHVILSELWTSPEFRKENGSLVETYSETTPTNADANYNSLVTNLAERTQTWFSHRPTANGIEQLDPDFLLEVYSEAVPGDLSRDTRGNSLFDIIKANLRKIVDDELLGVLNCKQISEGRIGQDDMLTILAQKGPKTATTGAKQRERGTENISDAVDPREIDTIPVVSLTMTYSIRSAPHAAHEAVNAPH